MAVNRIRELYAIGGPSEVLAGIGRFCYWNILKPNTDWLFQPDYAGVRVGTNGLLPLHTYRNYAQYKRGLLTAIDEHITPGNRVTIVGSRGVDAVKCIEAGAASVRVIEAATEMVDITNETLRLNLDESNVKRATVEHAIIGNVIDVYGDASNARVINTSELEPGDVLILDCEGAEQSILRGLSTWPDTVICEAHPEHGVPASEIVDLLETAGYETTRRTYKPDHTDPAKDIVIGSRLH